MAAQENKDFVRRYLEELSFKPKPASVIDTYVEEQLLKDHIAVFEEACPQYGIEIEKMIAEDDMVSVIGQVRGTNTGPFMGAPATGKSFNIPIHITYRIENGKIVEHWMLTDNFSMMQQLGLIPSAA
jgi:predicted ester cyclase